MCIRTRQKWGVTSPWLVNEPWWPAPPRDEEAMAQGKGFKALQRRLGLSNRAWRIAGIVAGVVVLALIVTLVRGAVQAEVHPEPCRAGYRPADREPEPHRSGSCRALGKRHRHAPRHSCSGRWRSTRRTSAPASRLLRFVSRPDGAAGGSTAAGAGPVGLRRGGSSGGSSGGTTRFDRRPRPEHSTRRWISRSSCR